MNELIDEDRRYTGSHYENDNDDKRQFMCCACEEKSFHVNNPQTTLKCECQKGVLLLMPLTMPYPTYAPGTKLTTYQKKVREVLRLWKNGWMADRREMLKECGLIPYRDYDATEESQMESKRLCHSKDMPMKVYAWYHKHFLPQFIAGFPPEANIDLEQTSLVSKLIESGGVMQW